MIACDTNPPREASAPESTAAPTEPKKPVDAPVLPRGSAEFSPSLTSLSNASDYDLDVHVEVEQCTECHAEIVDEWRDSVHALASLSNPFYRFAFDTFANESGREKLQFCGGCHDPALMYSQAIKRPVEPDSVATHAGISCNTCHGIEQATTDGNGSYVLNTSPIPIPEDGDEASLKAHLARVAMAPLRTNALCVSCHRGFMSPETGHEVVISGVDDWGPFRRSGYNGNPVTRITDVAPTNCVGCHMPVMPDGHNSHRFPGGHTTMAALTSPEQLAAVRTMVEDAATIDIPTYGVGDVKLGPWKGFKPRDSVWFDIVVHNKNVGHTFPGGVQDLRDTWVEVQVTDANGRVVATAGTEHATGDDPTTYTLQSYMVNDDGVRVPDHSVHGFRTPVFAHGIAPKDSAVIRYRFEPNASAAQPLSVKATLRHRRLTREAQDAVCEHTKLESDAAFAAGARKYRGFEGDPCAEQPILEVDTKTVVLGEEDDSTTPAWLRQYHRGQGLAHHVSESLEEAADAFRAALAILGPQGDSRSLAKTHFELGRVYGRQGRLQDALDQFSQAEELVGKHAAIEFGRGDAYMRVFKFKDAASCYDAASKLANDDRVWRQLAIASGSINDSATTYEASRKGLAIEPRDPHLLQNQMLALKKLDADEDWVKGASKAFNDFKRDEKAPRIQDTCATNDEECRKGRIPVPVIDMRKAD